MKMLTVRMIDCIESGLPSGDYCILSTLRCHVPAPGRIKNIDVGESPIRFTINLNWDWFDGYHSVVVCWSRKTGITRKYNVLFYYRRKDAAQAGEWVCISTYQGIRPLGTSSGYDDDNYNGSETSKWRSTESLVITP